MAFSNSNDSDIRVIKKKKQHAGHHGGAWKVAYADFVTAMMAFFLVMWVTGMSEDVKSAIAGYFKDPEGFMKQVKAGNALFRITDAQAGSISNRTSPSYQDNQKKILSGARERIVKSVGAIDPRVQKAADAASKGLAKADAGNGNNGGSGSGGGGGSGIEGLRGNVSVKMTDEGLEIDLLENRESLFFEPAKAVLKPKGHQVLAIIARELRDLSNKIVIEGHTDSRPLRTLAYSNWELSADRANAARKAMMEAGIGKAQMSEIRGYADTQPLNVRQPDSFNNRRVSILVMYHKVVPIQGGDAARAEAAQKPL